MPDIKVNVKSQNLNESTPEEQRAPSKDDKLSHGPQRGEAKEYLPASYKTTRGNVRTDR